MAYSKGIYHYILLFCYVCHSKYYRLGDLNNRNLFSQSPGGQKSNNSWFLVSPPPPPWLAEIHLLTMSVHSLFFCILLLALPLQRRTSASSDLGPTLITAFNLNYLLKALSSNTIPLGVRASTYQFGRSKQEHNSAYNNYPLQNLKKKKCEFQTHLTLRVLNRVL